MRQRSLALLLLGTALVARSAGSQVLDGSLFGTVLDHTGAPLAGAAVSLEPAADGAAPNAPIAPAQSDEKGRFTFLGLVPGNHRLQARRTGYLTASYPSVDIQAGRPTVVRIEMSPVPGETVTVTAEPPLERNGAFVPHLTVHRAELETVPTPRDPWSIARLTPGVLVSGFNSGGSESGQQPVLIGPGANREQNAFLLDGVVLTDMAALGTSSTFFDFEQFEEVTVSTGGSDLAVGNAGATLSLLTKRGGDAWRGAARYYLTPADGQGRASAASNRVRQIDETGIEGGGRLVREHLWIWGSRAESSIARRTHRELPIEIDLSSSSLKLNFEGRDHSVTAQGVAGRKATDGRDANPKRAPETWLRQDAPLAFARLEDAWAFDPSRLLRASVSTLSGRNDFTPRGGTGAEIRFGDDGVWHGGYATSRRDLEASQAQIDGELAPALPSSHTPSAGASWREATDALQSVWGPRNLTHWSADSWGLEDPVVELTRAARGRYSTRLFAAWMGDVRRTRRATVQFGLRWDAQSGRNHAANVPAHPVFPELMPALSFGGADAGFEWRSLSPRAAWSREVGGDGRTTLRAAAARYPGQFGSSLLLRTDPLAAFAAVTYRDLDGDGLFTDGEPWRLVWTDNFDPRDPRRLEAVHQADPELDPEMHDALYLGLERRLGSGWHADLEISYRRVRDVLEARPLVRGGDGAVRVARREDYLLRRVLVGSLPDGSTFEAPVYGLREGLELTGGTRLVNGDRRQDHAGATLAFTRPLDDRWMMRAHFTVADWRWRIGDGFRAFDDPTDAAPAFPNYRIGDSADGDGDAVVVTAQSESERDGGFFLNSRWSAALTGLVRVAPDRPWGFAVAGSLVGREGSPIPYAVRVAGPDGAVRWVQATPKSDSYRSDDLILVDLHLEKEHRLRRTTMRWTLDAFNALDAAPALQRSRLADPEQGGRALESASPRVFRLGLRLGLGSP